MNLNFVQEVNQGLESMGGKWTELDLDIPLGSRGVDIADRTGMRETFLTVLFVKDLFILKIDSLSIYRQSLGKKDNFINQDAY